MHPCFLGDRLMEGMRGAAGTLLMRYIRQLQCVPLGFKRLKPAGTHAALVGESAYIHFLIDVCAVGFRPRKGGRLIGRLGNVQTAVGVNFTILNNFNCFVHKNGLPEGAWYDSIKSSWMESDTTKIGGKVNRPVRLILTEDLQESSAGAPVTFRGAMEDAMSAETRKWMMGDGVVAGARSASAAASSMNAKAGKVAASGSKSASGSDARAGKADKAVAAAAKGSRAGSSGVSADSAAAAGARAAPGAAGAKAAASAGQPPKRRASTSNGSAPVDPVGAPEAPTAAPPKRRKT